jgi:hypothetical protein
MRTGKMKKEEGKNEGIVKIGKKLKGMKKKKINCPSKRRILQARVKKNRTMYNFTNWLTFSPSFYLTADRSGRAV